MQAISNVLADRKALRAVALAVLGSLLLWASAKIQVPFYPVPMTFQTAVVFLIGLAYGWRLAVATLLLYLAQGAMGLPVFAGTPEKGIGLPYMVGPTGGYLAGFVAAAAITGWVGERSRHWLATAGGAARRHGRHLSSGCGLARPVRRCREGGEPGRAAVPPGRRGQAGPGPGGDRGRPEAAARLIRAADAARHRRGGRHPAPGRARGLPDRDRLRPGCRRHQRRGGGAHLRRQGQARAQSPDRPRGRSRRGARHRPLRRPGPAARGRLLAGTPDPGPAPGRGCAPVAAGHGRPGHGGGADPRPPDRPRPARGHPPAGGRPQRQPVGPGQPDHRRPCRGRSRFRGRAGPRRGCLRGRGREQRARPQRERAAPAATGRPRPRGPGAAGRPPGRPYR